MDSGSEAGMTTNDYSSIFVRISVYRRCTPYKIILNLKSEIVTLIPSAQADSIMLAMTKTGARIASLRSQHRHGRLCYRLIF
jgi:hypothetical protein